MHTHSLIKRVGSKTMHWSVVPMHWWTAPISSTSSPSCKNSDVNLFKKLHGSGKRRLMRAKKVRYIDDSVWQSPSGDNSIAMPLPLPALSRDASSGNRSGSPGNANAAKASLPSPPSKRRERGVSVGGSVTVEGRGDDVSTAPPFKFRSRLACQECQRSKNAPRSHMSPQELNNARQLQDPYANHVHASAPTSPFSTPELCSNKACGDMYISPHIFPQNFQVWSAPEIPTLDMNLGFSHRIRSDMMPSTADNSPLQSPQQLSPNGHPSPFVKKLPLDTKSARRDSNCQANIHPLPLPPGATLPSQTALSPHLTARTEIVPLKPQWQKGKLIGRGTFGSVYVASNRETGALCAMKEVEIAFDDPKSAECIKQLEQEIKVLSKLKHPNIVQYYGSEIIGDRFYIYLEYVHPGSINRYIHDHCEAMTESVVRNFTRHILSGLAYLHSKKTIHRDIKGANLLVDAHGVVKLADFGMAKHLTGPDANLSLKGSPYWMAPELLQSVMQKDASSDLALAVDIWSLGCTIIEMLDGKPPWSEYEGAAAMFKVIRETPPIPKTLSREGKDFLRCCFRRNPADRPTAAMLLEHRFLKRPHTIDVSACTLAINEMTITNESSSTAEPFNHKRKVLSLSPEAQIIDVHLANNSISSLLSPPNQVDIQNRCPEKRPICDITIRLPT